jgi:hypothetical protein
MPFWIEFASCKHRAQCVLDDPLLTKDIEKNLKGDSIVLPQKECPMCRGYPKPTLIIFDWRILKGETANA